MGGLTTNTSHLTSVSETDITINDSSGAETRPKNVAVYICIKT
jgi:hypothetical protein